MNCEMCGADERLFRTSVEGAELNLCKKCAKFGKVISPVRREIKESKKIKTKIKKETGPKKELIQVIAPNYGQIIRNAREKLGLKQEDFAKKINEKVSLIRNIEINKFKPNIGLTRKLERFLKVKLIEQYEEVHEKISKPRTDTFTIGDFIKIKK